MKLNELQRALQEQPNTYPRFVLPDGDRIPAHAHITEIGQVVRTFIDCGGVMGREEKVLLQTHVGKDTQHRLRSDRFAKILQLGNRIISNPQLNVEVEYDCCVLAQFPIANMKVENDRLDLFLGRGRTQCRARERREATVAGECCSTVAPCC